MERPENDIVITATQTYGAKQKPRPVSARTPSESVQLQIGTWDGHHKEAQYVQSQATASKEAPAPRQKKTQER